MISQAAWKWWYGHQRVVRALNAMAGPAEAGSDWYWDGNPGFPGEEFVDVGGEFLTDEGGVTLIR